MDIKRINPGQIPSKPAGEPDSAKQPTKAFGDAAQANQTPAAAGRPAWMDGVRSDFKRADLSTARFDSVVNRSISALLDSASQRMGSIPPSVREKIAAMLAADPVFTKRVALYMDKNLE